MSANKGPNQSWSTPQQPQVIVHRLDPNLLYRIDYFLMLYAKATGATIDTSKLDAALAKFDAATTDLSKDLKDQP